MNGQREGALEQNGESVRRRCIRGEGNEKINVEKKQQREERIAGEQ
jgi:hypothetical protein